MPLVTYLRCTTCGREQTVIGPLAIATYQEPDWQVSEFEFYNPDGKHYCADHKVRTWTLYCQDFDCSYCGYGHEGTSVEVNAALTGEDVFASHYPWWTCAGDFALGGVESDKGEIFA